MGKWQDRVPTLSPFRTDLLGVEKPITNSAPLPSLPHPTPGGTIDPKTNTKTKTKKKPPAVRRLVGSTFGPAVAQAGVDVLVLVTRWAG